MMKKLLPCSCLLACCFLMLNAGCRDDAPEPKRYYLSDIVVSSRDGADIGAYAIINGNEINATVPHDGTVETRFKVELKFPSDAGSVSVAPENGGIYDFSSPQQFSVKYADGRTEVYTMTLRRSGELAPAITRFEIRFVAPEISYTNTSTGDRYMRYPAGTDLSAVEPWIHYNAPSVRQLSPGKIVDFSRGPVGYLLQNGGLQRLFSVTLSNYGYGKHMPVSNFTVANDSKRLEKLEGTEGPIAFDNTGNYLYVANEDALHRYQCSGNNTQTPSIMNLTENGQTFKVGHIESVYMTVNESLQWGFYGCNAIEGGGIFKIYYWSAVNAVPKVVAEIDLTEEGATIDCFSWKVVNNRICAYMVDRAPLAAETPVDPKIYIIRDLATFNKIMTYETVQLTGAVELGITNAPHAMLSPVDGTNDFLLTNGTSSPIYIEYSTATASLKATAVFPVTTLLPGTIMGIRTFGFIRGKYIAWVESSTTDTEDNSAFLTILDVSADGFKTAIDKIIAEGHEHGSLMKYTRFRIPLGNVGNPEKFGHVAIFPIGTRLRIAASVGNNGIYAFEWE